jgi:galactokinase/mevalonate kinase-like predicted kinase/cob(I)alamin adenosyltransferase
MRGNPIIQYSEVLCELGVENRNIWIDNSHISSGWKFSERNIVTGAPENNWNLTLLPGICIDFVPVDGSKICVRVYGFDDQFRGAIDDCGTLWLDHSVADWFKVRKLELVECGLDLSGDIQESPIFPVLDKNDIDQEFIIWLIELAPRYNADMSARWQKSVRFSANDILLNADVVRNVERRREYLIDKFKSMTVDDWQQSGSCLDLGATAYLLNSYELKLPPLNDSDEDGCDLEYVHDRMLRAMVTGKSGKKPDKIYAQQAFKGLRELIIGGTGVNAVKPSKNILDDQIIWGRSPIRLDLAGGWSDTPPYWLEYGGSVVNVAVDLNGQPPIQVFARVSEEPSIVIRSIDLGLEDRITSYSDLQELGKLGSGFGIARAALALAGLSPEFHTSNGFSSLERQLENEFGGGIEISMLAAIPKGSGLGTSSILSATLLGTLSELCGHYWTMDDLFIRTLALEQMLTSGGGWQDQAGGIYGGIKLLETKPGLTQNAVVRWLPYDLLSGNNVNTRVLLYYTGITRVAHDILGEIVRKIFLNSSDLHEIINDISTNSRFAADAIQRNDWNSLCEAVRRSWQMNQELDSGTNPETVQDILDIAGNDVEAAKLLGAGGGGYMLIFTRDSEAGQRVRARLNDNPPNARARFIDMRVSETGFQLTRS